MKGDAGLWMKKFPELKNGLDETNHDNIQGEIAISDEEFICIKNVSSCDTWALSIFNSVNQSKKH